MPREAGIANAGMVEWRLFQGARFSGTPREMSNPVNAPRPSPPARRFDPFQVRPLPSPNPAAAAYARWLRLGDSMTRAIAEALGEAPRVCPGLEGPDRLAPWEADLLALSGVRCYAREVVLTVGGTAVLAARTVSRLQDPALELIRRLGNRPLAQLLFEDPDWRRSSAPIALIELGRRRIGRTSLWRYGRRGSSRILVTEFFEPGQLAGR